jgi:Secretion system C-terminal sorting domain
MEDIMKRLLLYLVALLLVAAVLPAKPRFAKAARVDTIGPSYPLVSIHDLQYVSPAALASCDSADAASGPSSTAWTLQTSAYSPSHNGGLNDTVEIVGQIIVPPKYISYTGVSGYNFTLRDTAAHASGAWSSVFVRTGPNAAGDPVNYADTLALYNAHLLDYLPGDIIRIRGYVAEYPTNNLVSYTEFVPIASTFVPSAEMGSCVEYIDTWPIPNPDTVTAGQFMNGIYTTSGKNIKFSTGEQWEDCYVQLTNLQVSSFVNTTNGTFSMQDASHNEIATMDGSKFFTTRTGTASGSPLLYRDPSSTYILPSVGQIIDTIRGYIATNSGSDAARGYRIYPVFKGDIVYGAVYPAISTHRRNPVAVTPTDSAIITVKTYQQTGGSVPKTVLVHYSLNNGPWQIANMLGPKAADSTYRGAIRPVGADTLVKYFITTDDGVGHVATYANAAGGSAWNDTTQGFFFYYVRNRALTIQDVQYTPFSNGTSGLLGAVVTIAGVVTVDTSDLNINSTKGTTPWYIQTGNAPWNGIWVYGTNQQLYTLKKGDSISVTGSVQEYLDGTSGSIGRVTRIYDSTVTVIDSGHAIPDPVVTTTDALAASNGVLTTEPYEGMLVRINNVTISTLSPTYSDSTEYAVNDGSGEVIIRSYESKSKYAPAPRIIDTLLGKSVFLKQGDQFSYIQGVLYFSYNQYKIVPRTNSDFGTYSPVTGITSGTNAIPKKFALSQNYPNPFNPSTKIDFDLPVGGTTSLKIYNILGQEVASLLNGYKAAGHFSVTFDASRYSSGVYIYRLQSASGFITKKMLLLK